MVESTTRDDSTWARLPAGSPDERARKTEEIRGWKKIGSLCDVGTTRAILGRTVLVSVEGELAALVACGDPRPRLRSVERSLCGVVPGTPVIR